MRPLRLAAAVVVTGLATLGLAAASTARLRVHAAPAARLRVAFSARPERIEQCRTLGADELANVPAHMRQSVVCEGTTARYRLEVRRDDSLLVSAQLRGGGLRHDRRLYALRELPVPAGRGTVDVRLTRVDTAAARPAGEREKSHDDDRDDSDAREHDGDAGRGEPLSRELDERRRRVADEVPPSLSLRETVELRPREVLLVTYDQQTRRLRIVRESP